ncbi:CS-domain-containing protein [Neurospora tetrasperma FGSC 2509]|nr:CS-domain-containing protein [Neurospora tetrasperma FGSC 2509]
MSEANKCVHQGCGKVYTDPEECCKPRVLTFEEFMTIEPCTEGKHSTTDLPPKIEKNEADPALLESLAATPPPPTRTPVPVAQHAPTPPPPAPESDDDEEGIEIPDGRVCRRKACGATYQKGASREGEKCVHHPGAPIFHEGSKGYSCCKRRVLEFDQFMKIEGCKTKDRHLFVGSGKKEAAAASGGEEILETVRTDFYQTPSSVIASFFLKKINKDAAKVEFKPNSIVLDLPTTDSPVKRYKTEVSLFGPIVPEKSSYKILGTKLEVTLWKADGSSWPVLRSDDRPTGEILQVGRAGRV